VALIVSFAVWEKATGSLLRTGSGWSYPLAGLVSLAFLWTLVFLSRVWRDPRVW
jgi:hypothetical protein